MSFAGKQILVVGGSSGIGLATVKNLSAGGAQVYNLSRKAGAHLPAGILHRNYDVLDENANVEGFLPDSLDGLVYSVGSINLKPFNRVSANDLLNDFRINVAGAVRVIQLALPALKRSGNASIVLVSTVAASVGMSFHASIAAAKGAVNGLTLSLAAEFAPIKIRVNAVAPSLTDTPLAAALLNSPERRESSALRHPLGRVGNPEDISAAITFLLSEQSSWVTGQIIGVDGGLGHLRKN